MSATNKEKTTREGPVRGESLGGSDSRPIGPIVYGGAIRRVKEERRLGTDGGSREEKERERVRRLSDSDSTDSRGSMASASSRFASMESLDQEGAGRFWSESRGQKRPRDKELSGSSTDTPAKGAHKRRGRGRPPTTGEYVGLAAAKEVLRKATEAEMRARAEAELLDSVLEARKTRSALATANPSTAENEEDTATTVLKRIGSSLEVVEKVAKKSSNLKGTFVRALQDAVSAIKEDVAGLAQRSISDETRALQADNTRLQAEMSSLRKELTELRQEMEKVRKQGSANTFMDVTMEAAPVRPPQPQQETSIEDICRTVMVQVGGMLNARLASLEDRLLPERNLRPPLASDKKKEARTYATATAEPTPVPSPGAQKTSGTKVPPVPAQPGPSRLTRQAPTVPKKGKKGSKKGAKKKEKTRPPTSENSKSSPVAPVATSNAPPRRPLNPDALEENWVTVGRNGKAQRHKSKAAPTQASTSPPASRPQRLKVPRSSAVVVTLTEAAIQKGLTYSSVLREARSKLDLKEVIGVEAVQFRRAVTGATIIRIPGATSAPKADILAQKLQEIYKNDDIKISRPEKMVDVKIEGLDDSTTPEEIKEAIIKKGACTTDQVRAGQLRQNRSGLYDIWAQVPVTTAKKLVTGRFLVGWVAAKVTIGRPRELRCYRCMQQGHTASRCDAEDRSRLCYKCGQEGHKAASCPSQPNCILCTAAGKDAKHRLGSLNCSAPRKTVPKRALAEVARSAPPPSGEEMEIAEAVQN
ncbi:caskin-1-like [Papilio machaon]|uniref:caskin-1-like n=1 Tax=Papilio machaon TaxID=76193 RepID=UPI001E66480C|nr:caskin-1-like [Papilio machaon]XP_045536281.1 caskin-1-like [Papilio machaon]XP_045536693.1 caskin-1-like [Papilio machaon]